MPLNIRDPRAHELAKRLAVKRKTTITQVIVTALENELHREREAQPLRDRLDGIARQLRSERGSSGRDMTKDEIDDMWGH